MVIIRENTEGLYSGIGERDADARDRRPRDHAARLRARDPQGVRAVARARQGRARRRQEARHLHRQAQRAPGLPAVPRGVPRGRARTSPTSSRTSRSSTRSRCSCSRSPSATTSCVTTNMFGDILTDLASRAAGRHGHGGRLQRRRRPRDVRADPRLGAAARRQGSREPDGDAARDRRGARRGSAAATATSACTARTRDRGRGRRDRRSAASRSPPISAARAGPRAVAAAIRDDVARRAGVAASAGWDLAATRGSLRAGLPRGPSASIEPRARAALQKMCRRRRAQSRVFRTHTPAL